MLHVRGNVAITDDQAKILQIVGRAASALSALGVVTIITVFCVAPHFRNPMHRLIFINAFYNAFDVACTMISVSGPAGGNASALCKFQAFINQMFPLADVLWTLVMAIDVFLIVFRRYDGESLKRLEWKYMAVITSVTFIPAFAFLFIETEEKGPVYGSVAIWCSISPKWVLLRILFYYIPIWHVLSMILISMVIYVLVGIEIVKRKGALQSFNSDPVPLEDSIASTADTPYKSSERRATEGNFPLRHGHASVSHSGEESPILPPKARVATSHTVDTPTRHLSISFRQYILMPIFFFLALLSVWVAPSTNRVGAFVNPDFLSYPLLVSVCATGSLRGFWNGVIFITIGMKSQRRRGDLERRATYRQ
ncbi:GPCR, family 2-like protein, partial [Metarhizium hybridum]